VEYAKGVFNLWLKVGLGHCGICKSRGPASPRRWGHLGVIVRANIF